MRQVVVAAALLLLGVACTAGPTATPSEPPAADPTASAPSTAVAPTGTPTPDPRVAAITTARELLGADVVAVAEQVVGLAAALDRARHEVPRGAAMGAALDAVAGTVDATTAAVERLRAAVATARDEAAGGLAAARAEVDAAAAAAAALADVAADTARAAAAEVAGLREVVALDEAMDDVVRGWDAPGSQSERRAALAELRDLAAALGDAAAALAPPPDGCEALRANRVHWAGLLAARTDDLAAVATGSSGVVYDELRDRYHRAPYGVDRAVADSEDRACWDRRSVLPTAAADAVQLVEEVEDALAR